MRSKNTIHGGKRKGAGAPVTVGADARLAVRVTAAQKAWLDDQPGGAGATIRALINAAMQAQGKD